MNQRTQDNDWCLVEEHGWVTVARPRPSLLDILFEQIFLSVFSRFLQFGRGVDRLVGLQTINRRFRLKSVGTANLQTRLVCCSCFTVAWCWTLSTFTSRESANKVVIIVFTHQILFLFFSKWWLFCRPLDHYSSNIPGEFLCVSVLSLFCTLIFYRPQICTPGQVIAESNSLRLGCPCPNLPHIDYSHTVSLLWIGAVSCWVTFSISPPSPLCRRPLSSPVHLSVAAASRWASDPALRTATQRKGHRDTKRPERRRSSLLNSSCDIHTAEVLLKEAAAASGAYDRIIYKRYKDGAALLKRSDCKLSNTTLTAAENISPTHTGVKHSCRLNVWAPHSSAAQSLACFYTFIR